MKIGIFIPGANGDVLYSMSILKYKKEIFGDDTELIWFVEKKIFYLFKNNEANVRDWALDYPSFIMTPELKLDQIKKNMFDDTQDLDDGYFVYPALIPLEKRGELKHLSECTRYAMGLLNKSISWRPFFNPLESEKQCINNFVDTLPKNKKNIMLETHYKSSQSTWNENMTIRTIEICTKMFGECNFLFASGVNTNEIKKPENIISCSHFSLREISLLYDYCDLFVGVSSGISVAVSCWHNKSVPMIQFCSDYWCSTFPVSNAPTELVTKCIADNLSRDSNGNITKVTNVEENIENEFYKRLRMIINKILIK